METKVTMPVAAKQTISTEKKYQLPSAPCSFTMPDGTRIHAPDGVITTSDPAVIEELEKACNCGHVYRYMGKQTAAQIPPAPVDAGKIN